MMSLLKQDHTPEEPLEAVIFVVKKLNLADRVFSGVEGRNASYNERGQGGEE
jgi:hypothetical protein